MLLIDLRNDGPQRQSVHDLKMVGTVAYPPMFLPCSKSCHIKKISAHVM